MEEKPEAPKTNSSRSLLESLRSGMQQMKPMFHKPLLSLSLRCYTMQFCMFLGMNTIRLWLPQLFSSMADYQEEHADDNASVSMCTILDYSVNRTAETLTNYQSACAEVRLCPIHLSLLISLNSSEDNSLIKPHHLLIYSFILLHHSDLLCFLFLNLISISFKDSKYLN